MNQASLILTCVCSSSLLSALGAYALIPKLQPASERSLESALPDPSFEKEIRAELEELRVELAQQNSLTRPSELARVSLEPALESGALDREIFADWIRDHVKEEALVDLPGSSDAGYPGESESALAAFLKILDLGLTTEEAKALWEEAAENGQVHELLLAMEERLQSVPESVESELERARAYYKARWLNPGVRRGLVAESNDAFSRALEHDPEHWEARYQKARNLAFWPAAYGGQAEAIRHFEHLVDQQSTRAIEPRFARTYLWLGNLYDQQGNPQKARATWSQGLALFPGDPKLTKKLKTLED